MLSTSDTSVWRCEVFSLCEEDTGISHIVLFLQYAATRSTDTENTVLLEGAYCRNSIPRINRTGNCSTHSSGSRQKMMNLMEPAAWWGEGRQNKIVYWSWYLRIPKNNTHRSSKEHYHCIFKTDQRHENLIDVKSLMAMHGAEPIGRASGGTWFPYCS